ncbi:MAG: hypothetical protein ACK5XW_13790, partial [Pseudanabaena sp.]|jgi:hypothetical protein
MWCGRTRTTSTQCVINSFGLRKSYFIMIYDCYRLIAKSPRSMSHLLSKQPMLLGFNYFCRAKGNLQEFSREQAC